MIEILTTVCFKPLFPNYNEKFICVGVVHSNTDDENADTATEFIISKMVQYLGFSAMEDYYKQYPGLAEDLIEKRSNHYYKPSKDERQYYHPLISGYCPNPSTETIDANNNHTNYFNKYLNPILTEAAANGCLYMVPSLDEIRQYNIIRSNFHKDELWFLERWDGN